MLKFPSVEQKAWSDSSEDHCCILYVEDLRHTDLELVDESLFDRTRNPVYGKQKTKALLYHPE